MQCQICFEKFDHSKHKPYVLIPCTHTICVDCLSKIRDPKCPHCTRLFHDKNPNWALLDLVADSDYDLMKQQLEKTLNETDILKKKLFHSHEKKVVENLNKIKFIKDGINRISNKLISLIRASEMKLINETMNIEYILNHNLSEIMSDCGKNYLDERLHEAKSQLDKNEMSELQLNKLGHDLVNLNLELTFKIDQIMKLDNDIFEFNPSKFINSIDTDLIGTLDNKTKINEEDEKYDEKLNERGLALNDQKRFEEALHFFNKSLEFNPKNAIVYKNKGNALVELEDYKAALECFDKAAEISPTLTASMQFKKGLIYKEMNDFQKSIECFDASITLSPKYDFVYFNKGNVYFEMNDYLKAIECFDKAILLNPNSNAIIYSNKGLCLYYLKEFDKAIEMLNKSIEMDPYNSVTYSSKGLVYYDLKEFIKTIDCFDKAIQLEPSNTNYLNWKAAVYIKLKEYDRAMEFYNKAIEIEPDNNCARQSREYLLNVLI